MVDTPIRATDAIRGTRPSPRRGPREPTARPPAPPRLSLPLGRNLLLMLVINAVPVAALAWAAVTWHDERRRLLLPAAAVVAACLVIAVAAWAILPLGRWLRVWPRWHVRHARWWWLWLLPAALGLVAQLLLWLAAGAAVLAALVVAGLALWHLAPGQHLP